MNISQDEAAFIPEVEVVEQGVHNYSSSDTYVKPTEPLLQERLEWFQDQKLALMVHWGLYCELGMVASWALSDKDGDWSRHQVNWTDDPETFKQQYFNLNHSFNPIRFQPETWAELAADNGFRYLIFTTKHHDGFCMWDTQYTDYKVTSEGCPFHTHKNADIVHHVFDAFRDKGLGIAAYFSKADWNIPYYWNPELGAGKPSWRGPSYVPAEHPEMWEKFTSFTRNQILELLKNYGHIDILWLDAGWVCKASGQDIDIGGIVEEARKIQPWLLSADRTVGGPYENYVTPEQCIPDAPLGVPWESCLTVGGDFAYDYNDTYKSPRELVRLLLNVVSMGGNLALNVSPQPDGRFPEGAIASVKGLGSWLKLNGDAIYGTRVCAPYKVGNIYFTKKNSTVYSICLYPDAQQPISLNVDIPYSGDVSSVTLLENGEALSFTRENNGISVTLPEHYIKDETPIAHVFVLR